LNHKPQDVESTGPPEQSEGASAPEIKITQEMVEAGASAYYASDRRFEFEEEIVKRIYRAMHGLAP